MLPLGKKIN